MKQFISYTLIIGLAVIIQGQKKTLDYSLALPKKKAELSGHENPGERQEYESLMLNIPGTGSVPANIRLKEVAFSRSIPTRESLALSDRRIKANTYESAGPYNIGGRTRAIRFDIRDENILLAGGVSGGIWKTQNAGSNWEKISPVDIRNSVTTIAQDPRDGHQDNWYFGTGELLGNSARGVGAPYRGSGIYASHDNGESWNVLESTIDNATPDRFTSMFQYIWNIEVNKNNTSQDELLVASYGGILRSTDGGISWELELGEELFGLPADTDLNASEAPFYTCLRQTKEGYFFAALSSATSSNGKLAQSAGFYFSADGQSWQKITPPGFPSYHERTVIGFDSNTKSIYWLTQGQTNEYLFKYAVNNVTNGKIAGSWTDLSLNIPNLGGSYGRFESQGGYNMLIEVHPQNSNVVYIGGTNLYRSIDGFATPYETDWIGGYSTKNDASVYPSHYPDQHAVIFHPTDPAKMISTNDGGIRITKNCLADSVTWSSLNNGFVTTQFYSIAQRKDASTYETSGGMQDQGTYLRTAPGINPSWNRILGGDGGYTALAPNLDFVFMEFQYGQIYRISWDVSTGITGYSRVDPIGGGGEDGTDYLFVNPYLLDPTNASKLYVCGANYLWRNENLAQIPGGSQKPTSVGWTRLEYSELNNGIYTCLEKALTEDMLLAGFYAESPGILKIENASAPGNNIQTFISSDLFPEAGYISNIAANPENEDEWMVTFSNYGIQSIFYTSDGGASFSTIGGNLEDEEDGSGYGPSVRWSEIIPNKAGIIYMVGTSTGLYSTTTLNGNNTQWTQEGADVIGNSVVTMIDYRDRDGRLIVATHGNGAFQSYMDDFRLFNKSSENISKLSVHPAYPNPFKTQIAINYDLPENGEVKIDLYDESGKLIRNLLFGPQYEGKNAAIWDGTNTAGVAVRPGIYFCKINFGKQQKTIRLAYQP